MTYLRKALFSICITLIALTANAEIKKEYIIEDDGFEWIELEDFSSRPIKYGAQDINGNMIIPMGDYIIGYRARSEDESYFNIRQYRKDSNGDDMTDDNGEYIIDSGVYTTTGKCIIPLARQFRDISKYHLDDGTEYYSFVRGDGCNEYGICDANGKILFKRSHQNNVFSSFFIGDIYVVVVWTPEQKLMGYYYDFNNNLIGTNHIGEEVYEKAKKLNLPHPLRNSPKKYGEGYAAVSTTRNNGGGSSAQTASSSSGRQPKATGTYTISSQGQSMTTGNYTEVGGPDMEVTIEFYDDGITVGGIWCEYAGTTSSGKKIYNDPMSFGGSSSTYYVDENYNVSKQSSFSSPFGSDFFNYTVVKGSVNIPKATPFRASGIHSGESYSGSIEEGDDNDKHKTKTYQKTCHLCGGSGKCVTCNGTHRYLNKLTNKYTTCPNCKPDGLCSSCGGTGKKR